MVNIYLFIELLHTANAVTTVNMLKAIRMENCKFANVVVLSDEKIVAQLDCKDSTDGDKVILNKIAKVNGVVQTNIIAVVRPVKH
jgi:DNA-binding Lrp family transcriptional regulator